MDYFDKIFGPGYGASKLTINTRIFLDEATQTRNYYKSFEIAFDEYVDLLNSVSRYGFMEGESADALRNYINLISRLNNVVYKLGERYRSMVMEFLQAIDDADGFLYPRGFTGERIYTDSMFKKLLKATDNDININYLRYVKAKTGTVNPYVFEHIVNMRYLCSDINSLQIQTKHKLITLKMNLRKIDSIYSRKLSDISEQLKEFTTVLRNFIEIVEPETGKINFPKMVELEALIEILEQPEIEIDGTIIYERIKYLLAKINIGEHYFGSPIWNIREYIRKYLRIYSIDRILHLRRHWLWLLRQGFIGEYEIPTATIKVWKSEFNGIVNAINIGETEDWWGDEATPITIQHFVDVVGRIPALGTSINNFLAMLEDLYIQIRTAEKIKQDVLEECDKEETPSEFKEIVIVHFDNTIIHWITQLIPPGHTNPDPFANRGLIKKILDQARSNEWVSEGTKGPVSDEMLCAWSEECDGHLSEAATEAQNTPEDAVGYNGVLDNVASWIEESRQAKMNLFERMANKSSGQKKEYYNYCHNQLDSSTIFNSDFVEMMSMDEFLSA